MLDFIKNSFLILQIKNSYIVHKNKEKEVKKESVDNTLMTLNPRIFV